MNPMIGSYVVITPVRNEESFLPLTIESITSQSHLPLEWIIVNDGSTDDTGQIADNAAARHAWIRTVHRKDRGFRKPGGGVVESFNEGLRALRSNEWEFLVKLDGDLSFESTYFANCLQRFLDMPDLGMGGGAILHDVKGTLTRETHPRFHVRGATKIYRRSCWESIGGLWPAPGWDTLDEVKAAMNGWQTHTFEDITLLHHRITGSADGFWNGAVKNGRANYISGYHPLFMLTKCASRLFKRPYFIGSAALAYGFMTGYLKRIERVDDADLIHYLRRQQVARLIGRPTIWR